MKSILLAFCIILSALGTHSKTIPDTKKVANYQEAARQFNTNEELAHKQREKREDGITGANVGNPLVEPRQEVKLSKKPRQTRETKMGQETPIEQIHDDTITFAKVTKYGIKIKV